MRGLGWDKEKKVRSEMERLGREIRWFDWDKEKKVWLGHFEKKPDFHEYKNPSPCLGPIYEIQTMFRPNICTDYKTLHVNWALSNFSLSSVSSPSPTHLCSYFHLVATLCWNYLVNLLSLNVIQYKFGLSHTQAIYKN